MLTKDIEWPFSFVETDDWKFVSWVLPFAERKSGFRRSGMEFNPRKGTSSCNPLRYSAKAKTQTGSAALLRITYGTSFQHFSWKKMGQHDLRSDHQVKKTSKYPKSNLSFLRGHVRTLHGSWPFLLNLSGYVYFIEYYKICFEIFISFTGGLICIVYALVMLNLWNNFEVTSVLRTRQIRASFNHDFLYKFCTNRLNGVIHIDRAPLSRACCVGLASYPPIAQFLFYCRI